MQTDMTWWMRLTDSVRTAGRGDAPLDEPIRMLRDGLGFDCATLVGPRRNTQGQEHPVLVNLDYPGNTIDFISTTYAAHCPAHRFAVEHRAASRFIDLPYDIRKLRTYKEALGPCGFHEGLTLPLAPRNPDDSSPGFLALSSLHGRPLRDESRLALTMLATEIGTLIDPQPNSPQALADLVVLAGVRMVEPRIGALADSPLSEDNLICLETLQRQSATELQFRHRDSSGGWWQIITATAREGALVRMQRTEPEDHLTAREVDVVGLLSRGWTNDEIATALCVTVRTVRSHIESALMKLDVPNRTALAREALTHGIDSFEAIQCHESNQKLAFGTSGRFRTGSAKSEQ